MTQEQMRMQNLFAGNQEIMDEVGKQIYLSFVPPRRKENNTCYGSFLKRTSESCFEKLMKMSAERTGKENENL